MFYEAGVVCYTDNTLNYLIINLGEKTMFNNFIDKKISGNEVMITSNEVMITSNEVMITSNEVMAP